MFCLRLDVEGPMVASARHLVRAGLRHLAIDTERAPAAVGRFGIKAAVEHASAEVVGPPLDVGARPNAELPTARNPVSRSYVMELPEVAWDEAEARPERRRSRQGEAEDGHLKGQLLGWGVGGLHV